MYRTTRTVAAGLALAVVAGCDEPTSPRGAGPAAARITGSPVASAGSSTEIGLEWTDDAPNENGWEVHRSTTGAGGVYTLQAMLAANATSYADVGLAPLTEYCYRVRSFRVVSRRTMFGELQGPACATTLGPPPAPTLTSAAPVPYGQVTLAWSLASSTNQGVRVERAAAADGPWATIASLPWWSTSHTDQGRPAEQVACYRVLAFNTFGDSPPSSARCTAPPKPPVIRTAVATGPGSIAVTWDDSSAVEDGYELQRARDDFVWSTVAMLPANATTHVDAALAANARYWYRVRATRDGGYSSFSGSTSAVVATTAPAAVTGVVAVPVASSATVVYWSGASSTADWVRVERSTDGATWSVVDSVPATNTYWPQDAGLVAEVQVCYRAIAGNHAGEAPPSALACTVPPAAPTNVRLRTNGDGTLEYAWTDNSAHEDGYALYLYVYYWDEYGGTYQEHVVTLPPNTTSHPAQGDDVFLGLWATKDGGSSDVVWGLEEQPASLAAAKPARAARRPVVRTPTPRTP